MQRLEQMEIGIPVSSDSKVGFSGPRLPTTSPRAIPESPWPGPRGSAPGSRSCRHAPAPQAQVGSGGYSQLRSYFNTPLASPSARRSPPPPRPPLLAPGRRPLFTTSQPPLPADLAAMTSAPPLPGFRLGKTSSRCQVRCLCRRKASWDLQPMGATELC